MVNIGSRQQGRDRGPNVVDVECNTAAICEAMRAQIARGRYGRHALYGNGDAGGRIAALLATTPLTIEKRLAYDDG